LGDQVDIHLKESEHNDLQTGIPARLGCGSIILLTILCSTLILAIVNLIVVGEIDVRGNDLEGLRIWLVREDGITGVGLSSSRQTDIASEPDLKCINTSVRFIKWVGEGSSGDIEYCECYQIQEGELFFSGACPP
jgi:hypothetical protein